MSHFFIKCVIISLIGLLTILIICGIGIFINYNGKEIKKYFIIDEILFFNKDL